MTTDRPRFWKSIPFLLSTLLIIFSYLGFWWLSAPETISKEVLASDSAAALEQNKAQETIPEEKEISSSTQSQTEQPHFEVNPVSVIATPVALTPEPLVPELTVKEHVLQKGDTLYLVLSRLGVSDREIYDITKSSKKIYNLKKIHPGQKIAVAFDANEAQLASVAYEIDALNHLEILHSEGQFTAKKTTIPLELGIERRAGSITDTLYESARRLGVPPEVILDLSDIFAWDVDFGNDIRTGDHFNLVYEVYRKEGEIIRAGRVLAAEVTNRGETIRAYYFKPEGERGDYYNEKGRSLRKAFLKSPLRYRYISSGYKTRRLHPILKVNRPHLGIDFAAGRDTPVRAASDGVVTFAGWNGGYGKTVIIRHRNGYKTLYGHLSSFFRGIKKGKKVKQEDFIGRVGSTGLSTGPHLHYTLYKNGKAINPRKAEVLRGKPLGKEWLPPFSNKVALMDHYLYPIPDLLAISDSL